ncbi:hypothetical protein BD560DRAFT_451587 [Blakeslea trispora]|nr:hypothetical protein BD560DRAFT_451587 [Blakeslea trispora]
MNKTISLGDSTLIHRLHSNERQLRTLVVILSLAGGLALSFVLGVGILICWSSQRYRKPHSTLSSSIPLSPSLLHSSIPEPSAPSAKELEHYPSPPPYTPS